MKTIEKRAAERYENPQEPYCFETDREQQWYRCGECDGYIAGATEQDSIARQNEREKIFRAICETCYAKLGSTQCKDECERLSKIRKAIEGGES